MVYLHITKQLRTKHYVGHRPVNQDPTDRCRMSSDGMVLTIVAELSFRESEATSISSEIVRVTSAPTHKRKHCARCSVHTKCKNSYRQVGMKEANKQYSRREIQFRRLR